MSNTLCENCLFSKTITSGSPCVFGIPNLIGETYSVENHNNYYKLINYNCRYGLSQQTHQENIDKFTGIDLIEYIKQQNIVKYSLSIVMLDGDVGATFNLLNSLSIKPNYITAICYHNGGLLHNLLSKQDPYIPYKVHNFLEDMPAAQALHVALETNKNKVGNLMWILNASSLQVCIDNDSIQNINYLINVTQQPAHYYQSKNIDSSFDGIFINTNNYWALSRTQDYTIEKNNQTLVVEYD